MHYRFEFVQRPAVTLALPLLDSQLGFQAQFHPIVEDVIHQLKVGLGATLHSVYVAGSIARCTAIPGRSDLNLTVIILRDLTAEEQSIISAIRLRFEGRQRLLTKLVFQIVTKDEVLALESVFSWGFWLKHCCRCYTGDDLSTRYGRFEASWDIAKTLNGDIAEQLGEYRQKIMQTKVLAHYLDYCREIAKKMIWTCYSLVLHRSKGLALSLAEAADAFLLFYPDKRVEIERLFLLVSGTQVPKKASLFMINDFGRWIKDEFDKIDRRIG
ncbi:nucleotidyltransferase domain-containing protein [Photobacterium nomapromontoriensis]|uniref:nucleotidyltransferase domain-containing protein n=1 Tax=Photobacterium nomapromontoriensis TaxID=2910237 RepID=UPI003D13860F